MSKEKKAVEVATKKFDRDAWIKAHFSDPARELSEYATLEEKVDLLSVQVIELAQQVKELQKRWDSIDEWFRERTQILAEDAAKEFIRLRSVADIAIETEQAKHERLQFEKNVDSAVTAALEKRLSEELPQLARAVFDGIVNKIQPHALRK